MYKSNKRLIILDADGTTIDAFSAITSTFSQHGMDLGNEDNFQKRHNLFKYMGGFKEFPRNIKKQISHRKRLIATLTDVYRDEAQLYPGIAELIQRLISAPNVVVGIVTRNITNQPIETLGKLFFRHGIDVAQLDFLHHIPVKQNKISAFKEIREHYDINPALSYICGDEHKDYHAALASGMHPFMVSYGFEDHQRLTEKFNIPEELIARSPRELCARVCHTLQLTELIDPD
ncbi:HAD family hydrolase [Solimicrobium silvestre]|uniref:phosphoglycolate phosphatase n=1 Tax=Solimicrobium silvestre TaxID=2099400 RepID=A0A2S9GVC2_9BURK|nr:HAD hydrolase-like protein [Solimicrobium silvestre]PRC91669.1 Haloacid dehalogenase-like hydrolase [Solimicrobium silvestre]